MPRFERICPRCGASNSYDKAQCVKCRAPLTRAARAQPPVACPFTKRGIAKLAWRATKFLTRTGFNMALTTTQRGIRRGKEYVQNRRQEDVKRETIDAEYKPRDWRVWSRTPEAQSKPESERIRWGTKK